MKSDFNVATLPAAQNDNYRHEHMLPYELVAVCPEAGGGWEARLLDGRCSGYGRTPEAALMDSDHALARYRALANDGLFIRLLSSAS